MHACVDVLLLASCMSHAGNAAATLLPACAGLMGWRTPTGSCSSWRRHARSRRCSGTPTASRSSWTRRLPQSRRPRSWPRRRRTRCDTMRTRGAWGQGAALRRACCLLLTASFTSARTVVLVSKCVPALVHSPALLASPRTSPPCLCLPPMTLHAGRPAAQHGGLPAGRGAHRDLRPHAGPDLDVRAAAHPQQDRARRGADLHAAHPQLAAASAARQRRRGAGRPAAAAVASASAAAAGAGASPVPRAAAAAAGAGGTQPGCVAPAAAAVRSGLCS